MNLMHKYVEFPPTAYAGGFDSLLHKLPKEQEASLVVLGTNGMPAVRMDVFYPSRLFPVRFCELSTLCCSICFMLQFPYQRIPDMCLEAHQCRVSRTKRSYQKLQ